MKAGQLWVSPAAYKHILANFLDDAKGFKKNDDLVCGRECHEVKAGDMVEANQRPVDQLQNLYHSDGDQLTSSCDLVLVPS